MERPLRADQGPDTGRARRRAGDRDPGLVTLLADTPPPGLSVEHQEILRLSLGLISVAEISARLSVPLGVARVLVGDLVEQQLVAITGPSRTAAPPSPSCCGGSSTAC
jgi:hypothetical protein